MPMPKMKNNSPDNFQTPPEALDCLLPYINRQWVIWEPAAGKGNIVNVLVNKNFRVFSSDIIDSVDFLTADPEPSVDCIITNPPYSIKEKFLARCYQLGKPFALLMPLTTFDGKARRALMRQHGIEVILPHKRFNFETPDHETRMKEGKKSSSQFYTCWFTWGLNIGQELVFTDPAQLGI